MTSKRSRPEPPNAAGPERLQKVLAQAGLGSRRACERLIEAGHVSIDGVVVTRLGTTVDPNLVRISVDGRPLPKSSALYYFMLHKPSGYVTTMNDPQGRPTVANLLPSLGARLYPVGRLDFGSEGLLLMTNDGDLTARLTHPRYGVEREYLVWINGDPTPATLARLRAGMEIDGTKYLPTEITRLPGQAVPGTALLRVVLQEGQKREVRRLCEAVGHSVRRLVRVRIGLLTLGALPLGKHRRLTAGEVEALRATVGLNSAGP